VNSAFDQTHAKYRDRLFLYAVHAIASQDLSDFETHISACEECRRELESLRPVIDSFAAWPTDVLRPSKPLWGRLARRIAVDAGTAPLLDPPQELSRSEWEEVAPGIACKLLATDVEKDRVSMLVRLAPGTDYPPHMHAGIEELHLLHGELMIDDKKVYPGDYVRADAGSVDHRVWSETGCTCVLITSTQDTLF
jgi:hypothetical protein